MESKTSELYLALPLLRMLTLSHVVQGYSTGRQYNNLCSQSQGTSIYYAHPDDCGKYYECDSGDAVERKCPCGKVFTDVDNKCVDRLSVQDTCTPANAVRECENEVADFIPHPEACQLYYNCSDTTSRYFFTKYVNECRYPDLFDINLKKCVGFENVECGHGRIAAKWVCDYLANTCHRSHCIPCNVHNPSCVGREDGVWPNPQKLWSRVFTSCVSERSKNGEEFCEKETLINMTQLFHPDKRQCLPLWEIPKEHGGYQPSCDSKSPGFYDIYHLEIVAFQCPGEEKFICRPPFSFHHNISQCIAV